MAASMPVPTDLGLDYLSSPDEAIDAVARLWRADLDEATVLLKSTPSTAAWNNAPLGWLVAADTARASADLAEPRVGSPDVERIRPTTELFAPLCTPLPGATPRPASTQ